MLANTGPGTKLSFRLLPVSVRTSVPVMSAGMRSGVNWSRENSRLSMWEMVLTSSVLAKPGAPVMRQCPPAKSEIRSCSTTSFWPTMVLRSSALILA